MTQSPEHARRLIWFCSTEDVADHPESLAQLRDDIGLTTIMPESYVCHTSGFRASPALAARGPFEDWQERLDRWPRGAEGIYPPVSGTVGGFDDSALLKVIESSRAAGIEVWGHLGLWSYGGDVFPELALQDQDGSPLGVGREPNRWGIGLCPSRRSVAEWTRDCFADVAGRYDLDGFCVDHARYPSPANAACLKTCACAECRRESEALGYDFDDLLAGLGRLQNALTRSDGPTLLSTARECGDVLDFARVVTGDNAADRWFHSRAALLAARMTEFGQVVKEVSADLVFGSDVFAPSIALLGGQNLADWEQVTDYLTGGSSSGGNVGWATAVTNLADEWVPLICAHVPETSEATALEIIYTLFGCQDAGEGMPMTRAAVEDGPLPVTELYQLEIERLIALTSGAVPLYPPISAHGDPERVRRLCASVVEAGCHGAMLGIDPRNAPVLKVLSEELGRL